MIVIGSPVYFGYPTGQVRSLVERLLFPLDTYLFDEQGNRMKVPHKPVQTALIYTMNCPESLFDQMGYHALFQRYENWMKLYFGHCETLFAADTMQVKDYSRFELAGFYEEAKRQYRDEHWEEDLQKAFDAGRRMAEQILA